MVWLPQDLVKILTVSVCQTKPQSAKLISRNLFFGFRLGFRRSRWRRRRRRWSPSWSSSTTSATATSPPPSSGESPLRPPPVSEDNWSLMQRSLNLDLQYDQDHLSLILISQITSNDLLHQFWWYSRTLISSCLAMNLQKYESHGRQYCKWD